MSAFMMTFAHDLLYYCVDDDITLSPNRLSPNHLLPNRLVNCPYVNVVALL